MNLIRRLKISDVVTEDLNVISNFISTYYTDICTLEEYQKNSTLFRTLRNLSKAECFQNLSLNKIELCIKALKNNKSPGNDGLMSDFYKTFVSDLSKVLLTVILIVKYILKPY